MLMNDLIKMRIFELLSEASQEVLMTNYKMPMASYWNISGV